jgi:hypothetical protein
MADTANAQFSANLNTLQWTPGSGPDSTIAARTYALRAKLAQLRVPAAVKSSATVPQESTAALGWHITFGSIGRPDEEKRSQDHGPVIASSSVTVTMAKKAGSAGWSFGSGTDSRPSCRETAPGISANRQRRETWNAVLAVLLSDG